MAALVSVLATPAVAQLPDVGDSARRRPVNAGLVPWSSLVRVQAPGLTRCTGVLLAPDRVATAAHCLFSRRLGHFIPPGSVHVLLGYGHGRHAGHAVAATYATASGFDPRRVDATCGADLAVIVLASPLEGPVLALDKDGVAAQWRSGAISRSGRRRWPPTCLAGSRREYATRRAGRCWRMIVRRRVEAAARQSCGSLMVHGGLPASRWLRGPTGRAGLRVLLSD